MLKCRSESWRKCLLLENYWALKSTQDSTDGSQSASATCWLPVGYRGQPSGQTANLLKAVVETCGSCIAEQTADERILSAFIAYAGDHAHQWPEGAALHYLNAMHEAFPCEYDQK
jgi:hypothetical protein